MATYTKETALYDTGAISGDIDDASTKATAFLAADSSGIMVYDGSGGAQTPSSPSANTNNVFIDTNSLDIRQGTDVLAAFSADGTFIYNDGSAVAKITKGSGSDNGRIGIGALLTADNDSRVTIDDWSGTNVSQGTFTVKYKDSSMTGSSRGRMDMTMTSNQAGVRISASGAGYSGAYIDISSMAAYPDGGIVLEARKTMLSLSANPSSGDDYALYQAITALGWQNDVIE